MISNVMQKTFNIKGIEKVVKGDLITLSFMSGKVYAVAKDESNYTPFQVPAGKKLTVLGFEVGVHRGAFTVGVLELVYGDNITETDDGPTNQHWLHKQWVIYSPTPNNRMINVQNKVVPEGKYLHVRKTPTGTWSEGQIICLLEDA